MTLPQSPSSEVPGPRGWEAFRTVKAIGVDPFTTLATDIGRFGDVVRYPMGLVTVYFLHHPDHVRHVLETNHANFRRSPFYARMRTLLGQGLITSDGELWKKQRRTIQPGFSRQRLASFVGLMVDKTEERLDRWSPSATAGTPIDIAREMMELSLTLAGWTLFTADVSSSAKIFEEQLPLALEEVDRRFNELFVWPDWMPTVRNWRMARAVKAMDGLIYQLMDQRRKAAQGADRGDGDLLDLLIQARDPDTGLPMPDKQIRDEAMTLLLAGHETTANLLAWTLHLLATHPEIQEAVAREVVETWGSESPTSSRLGELTLTRRVIFEALRLYPPAWSMDREVIADDVIGGYKIPAGSVVFFPPYFVHRHRDTWTEAERFDPDRFTDEAVAARHRHAYIPFGSGARACIGRELALMNATVVLGLIMKRYRVRSVPGHKVAMQAAITLRPRHGLAMHLESRTSPRG